MNKEPKLPKLPVPNAAAMGQLIKHNVPKHLHKYVTALIVCISSDFNHKYELAKAVADCESLNLSDKDIKLAQNKALTIIYKEGS